MAELFGSDSFFRQLLQLRRDNREQMALVLFRQVEKVCRSIVYYRSEYGFSGATQDDLECYSQAAFIDLLETIDRYLEDPRNDPDRPSEQSFSAFQRQKWLFYQVLTSMKAEKKRLYDAFTVVSLNGGSGDPDSGDAPLGTRIPDGTQSAERRLLQADAISSRFRQFLESSCATETVLCVLYSILAQEHDSRTTYEDCEQDLQEKTLEEIGEMIVNCLEEMPLDPGVLKLVIPDLRKSMQARLKKEEKEKTVDGVTADRLRKSKSRLMSLLARQEGD